MRIFLKFPQLNLLIWLVLLLHQYLCHDHEYSPNELLSQIRRTKQLIQLYESKLQILMKIARQQNIQQKQAVQHDSQEMNTDTGEMNDVGESIGDNGNNIDEQGQAKGTQPQFKLEQQIAYQSQLQTEFGVQSDYLGNKAVTWIQPHFVLDNIAHEIVDTTSRMVKIRNVHNRVINLQNNQVTLWDSQDTIRVITFKDEVVQRQISMKVQNVAAKWHRATKFEDILMQHQGSTLILTSSREQHKVKFKSPVIDVFSIHQYRILFVTSQSYGFMNPKSLELLSEHSIAAFSYNHTDKQASYQLQSAKANSITSAYYFNQAGIFFVLFHNLTMAVYEGDKVVGCLHYALPQSINHGAQISIAYFGTGYLFVHNSMSCFHVLEVSGNTINGYTVSSYREVCPPNLDSSSTLYRYQFFKHHNIHKILITPTNTQTPNCRLFHLKLTEKQVQTQRSIPWKLIIIVLGVIAVVFYKSRKSNGEKKSRLEQLEETNVNRRKSNRKVVPIKRDKNEKANYQSDYLKQISQQIKKNRLNVGKDE